ncbi:hypothetical protein ACFY1P_19995 [Streptomyces sp. NPDC001407]|uniref:hypothetical protein n=1 Tax=Streptomyces sp. NPDC001407 TaxID=3364573 RepID=UPI0036CAAB37
MSTTVPSSEKQKIWYLATLGRTALLQQLSQLGTLVPTSLTHDPLSCARWAVLASGRLTPEAQQAVESALLPLADAASFSVTLTIDDAPVHHTGIVPVFTEHTAGAVTGQYAELMLLEHGGLANKAAFRLSRMPTDKGWIIDADFQPSGIPAAQRPFGSARGGRNRTVLPPVAAELNRLAAQVERSAL